MSRTGKNFEGRDGTVARPRNDIAASIARRKTVLTEMLVNGIPTDLAQPLPKSLRQLRTWDVPALGVSPIRWVNAFTTTNSRYGRSIKELKGLLDRVNDTHRGAGAVSQNPLAASSGRKPRRRSLPESGVVAIQRDSKASGTHSSDQRLVAAVSQWHAERSNHLTEKSRADNAEAHLELVRAESARKDAELAELKRRLSTMMRPQVVR